MLCPDQSARWKDIYYNVKENGYSFKGVGALCQKLFPLHFWKGSTLKKERIYQDHPVAFNVGMIQHRSDSYTTYKGGDSHRESWHFLAVCLNCAMFVSYTPRYGRYVNTFTPADQNMFLCKQCTVELQWLEHLWDHWKLFEPWVVRANEG